MTDRPFPPPGVHVGGLPDQPGGDQAQSQGLSGQCAAAAVVVPPPCLRVHIPPLLRRFTSSTCAPKTPNTPENCGWSGRETSPTASHDASTPGGLSKPPPPKPARAGRRSRGRRHVFLFEYAASAPPSLTLRLPSPNQQKQTGVNSCRIKVGNHLFGSRGMYRCFIQIEAESTYQRVFLLPSPLRPAGGAGGPGSGGGEAV